jgi:aryl-alcohol dehydrogenase-like predicted oxidoreductase
VSRSLSDQGITMKYTTFARTGWSVSEIGLGGWQFGGAWGEVDDRDSIDTLLYAFEKGVNFVDTAEAYGAGRSEAVIGKALREWRGGKIYVATKAQPVRWPDPSDDRPLMRGRYPHWYLREHVEASLLRLGVDHIDLYQLHCWVPDGIAALDWLEALNTLRVEGKIDRIGVSIRDYRPDEAVDLIRLGLVSSVQVVFNMFEQLPAEALLPEAAAAETAVIARVPLDSGSLVGHWTAATYQQFPPGSVPSILFRDERFGETLRRVEALKAVCAPHYATLAEVAMRYVLHAPAVTTVIPGMKSRKEVDMNVAYSDGSAFPVELADAIPAHAFHRPPDFYRGA